MKTLPRKLKISRVWIEHKHDEAWRVCLDGVTGVPLTYDGGISGKLIEGKSSHFELVPLDRAKAFYRGEWSFIGIIAKCEIVSPAGIVQTLHGGGLWGVESDSGKEYLEEIAQEQLQELRVELLALGIGERAITHAFRNVGRKE